MHDQEIIRLVLQSSTINFNNLKYVLDKQSFIFTWYIFNPTRNKKINDYIIISCVPTVVDAESEDLSMAETQPYESNSNHQLKESSCFLTVDNIIEFQLLFDFE